MRTKMLSSLCSTHSLRAFLLKCVSVIVLSQLTISLALADDTDADNPWLNTRENASNPLSIVNYTDFRYQYQSGDIEDKHRLFIDGALIATPRLKIRYDLSYIQTDRSGDEEDDFEDLAIQPVFFPFDGRVSEKWYFRSAVGFNWTYDFDNDDKGIGFGSDRIGPLIGFGLANLETGVNAAAILQHTLSYNGDFDINQTALSITGVKRFGETEWISADTVIIHDWESDEWLPSLSLQAGHNFGKSWAIFVDGLAGFGTDRLFDAGAGLGIRLYY